MLISESQEEIRLELVADTNHSGKDRRILILVGALGVFNAILSVRHNTVNVGTLGERVVIASGNDPAGEFVILIGLSNAVRSFGIQVGSANENLTAGSRDAGRHAKAPALKGGSEAVVPTRLFLCVGIDNRLSGVELRGIHHAETAAHLRELDFVKVLSTGEELQNFEVVITTEGDRETVVNVACICQSAVCISRLIVDGVNSKVQIQRTVGVAGTDSIVTITAGFVFSVVGTHAILSKDLEAGKVRRFVGFMLSHKPPPMAQEPA